MLNIKIFYCNKFTCGNRACADHSSHTFFLIFLVSLAGTRTNVVHFFNLNFFVNAEN